MKSKKTFNIVLTADEAELVGNALLKSHFDSVGKNEDVKQEELEYLLPKLGFKKKYINNDFFQKNEYWEWIFDKKKYNE